MCLSRQLRFQLISNIYGFICITTKRIQRDNEISLTIEYKIMRCMKYRFITILHYLKLSKPDCRIPLSSGMISNKASVLNDVLNYKSKLSLHTLGMHSIDEFKDQTFYVIDGEFDEGVTSNDVNHFGTSLTFAYLRQIQWLTDRFWFLRDNSIYVRDGFLFVYDKVIEDGYTFKAALSTINTKATTQFETVTFTKEEIIELAKDMKVIDVEDVRSGSNYKQVTQHQYFKSADVGRKMMAWIYIFHARAIAAITIKVLMYITAMEALVSTSTAELSHQVAERVALLIGKNAEERMCIYNNIKKGYNVRSKAAHGEPQKGTEQVIADLLLQLDDYMRRLMKLDTPCDLEPDKLNDFFIKRLMGEENFRV